MIALALGWYLLVAPGATEMHQDAIVYADAALGQWTQLGSYSTAEDCEHARRAWAVAQIRRAETRRPFAEELQNDALNYKNSLALAEVSQCVASDDPRLR